MEDLCGVSFLLGLHVVKCQLIAGSGEPVEEVGPCQPDLQRDNLDIPDPSNKLSLGQARC